MTKLKAFADNNLNVASMMTSLFDKQENILRKGEKLVTSIISFSHNVFKSSLFQSLKLVNVW